MKVLATHVLLVFAFGAANAQDKVDANSAKTFWLKYSLIFLEGCQPTVSPTNIVFTRGNCSTNAYRGDILPRGTKITVTSIQRIKPFAIVSFARRSRNYRIIVDNRSPIAFRNAFALLLTKKELAEFYETKCPANLRTKRELIQCIGFPITVTREGKIEHYSYILEFVGPSPFSGYDGFTVKLKRNKIVNVSGYI